MKKVLLHLHRWGNWIIQHWHEARERCPGSGRTHGLKAHASQQVLGKEEEIPTADCCLSKCNRCKDCTKKRPFESIILIFVWKRISWNIERNTHNDIKSGGRVMERPWSAGCPSPKSPRIQPAAVIDVCGHAPDRKKTFNLPARENVLVQMLKKKKKRARAGMQINTWTQTRRNMWNINCQQAKIEYFQRLYEQGWVNLSAG